MCMCACSKHCFPATDFVAVDFEYFERALKEYKIPQQNIHAWKSSFCQVYSSVWVQKQFIMSQPHDTVLCPPKPAVFFPYWCMHYVDGIQIMGVGKKENIFFEDVKTPLDSYCLVLQSCSTHSATYKLLLKYVFKWLK